MRDQQRNRIGTAPLLVDEMQIKPVDRYRELSEGVELCLPGTPVEARLPIGGDVFGIGRAGPRRPGLQRWLVGPARSLQSRAKICDGDIADVAEGRLCWGESHSSLPHLA